MPAKSVAQQQFMAMCEHGNLPKDQCPHMTKAQMHDFAATSHKGLPKKVKRGKSR